MYHAGEDTYPIRLERRTADIFKFHLRDLEGVRNRKFHVPLLKVMTQTGGQIYAAKLYTPGTCFEATFS